MSEKTDTARIDRAAFLVACWWTDKLDNQFNEEVRMSFRCRLMETVGQALYWVGFPLEIETDYDPDCILLDALDAAGIKCKGFLFSSDGILPQKHLTTVLRWEIVTKEGYGNWKEPVVYWEEDDE